jgi:chromosome segregation ATPase
MTMDDLAQLQSRVEAARDRLGGVESDQRKYGLRLDDLVRIVEGALSRQSEELKAARIRSASLETELDDARNMIARQEVELAGKETDIARLETQNEQLRTMVMTLLDLVEGRNATPLREAMVRLERGVRHLLSETGSPGAKPMIQARAEEPAPAPKPSAPAAPSRPVLVQQPTAQQTIVPQSTVQGRVPMQRATDRQDEAPRQAEREREPTDPEALVELTSMNRSDREDIVKEPPEANAPVAQVVRRLSGESAASGDA